MDAEQGSRRRPSSSLRVGYHLTAGLLGVPLGIGGYMAGFGLSMGETPTWIIASYFAALGLAFGVVSPALIAGAVIGVLVLTSGEFGGGPLTVAMICLGGLAGVPLGLRARRRMWGRFQLSSPSRDRLESSAALKR